MERMKAVKAELGITVVSVNGESEYKGDVAKLEPYIEEGLIVVRTKVLQQQDDWMRWWKEESLRVSTNCFNT